LKIKIILSFVILSFVILIAFYFIPFSSFTWNSLSKDQSHWGAFGAYLGGVSTFIALLFAISSVNEWRKEKLFSVHLSLVNKLAGVFFDATTYVEYEKRLKAESVRGADASEHQNNKLKYRRKLTESYSDIFRDHMVLVSSEKKDYPSIIGVLGMLHNTISAPSQQVLVDLREKIQLAIKELTGGKISDEIGREIDTLYTNIKHF
jgi:hypothetical protein